MIPRETVTSGLVVWTTVENGSMPRGRGICGKKISPVRAGGEEDGDYDDDEMGDASAIDRDTSRGRARQRIKKLRPRTAVSRSRTPAGRGRGRGPASPATNSRPATSMRSVLCQPKPQSRTALRDQRRRMSHIHRRWHATWQHAFIRGGGVSLLVDALRRIVTIT